MTLSPPGFEGSEKRLEVDFRSSGRSDDTGLRRLSRGQLDEICTLAQCEIVSFTKNEHFDAYVLSESSLFVYPEKFVLKTCGTTRLLACVSRLTEFSVEVGCTILACKYSRASMKFPDAQPAPHCSFKEEVAYLNNAFDGTLKVGSAHVLGDQNNDTLWHVYHATAGTKDFKASKGNTMPRTTFEVIMNGLREDRANLFYLSQSPTAKVATKTSGIRDLFANSVIDDFMFDPCGYSMNALEGNGFGTIHITPESGFSYASVEFCGYEKINISQTLKKIVSIFQPESLVVAISSASSSSICDLKQMAPESFGFSHTCGSSILCEGGLHVAYHQFTALSVQLGSVMIKNSSINSLVSENMPDTPLGHDNSNSRYATTSDWSDDEQSSEPISKKPRTDIPNYAHDVFRAHSAVAMDSGKMSIDSHLKSLITQSPNDSAFYFVNLGVVIERFEAWKKRLPRVEPLYAVKCFGDPAILSLLANLGCGFDCASPAELESVMSLGVSPDRIIYANPCKPPQHLAHAKCVGVDLMTFDSESELEKIAVNFPQARLVLRLRADDPDARCPLGDKYGAEDYEILPLLQTGLRLNLNICGISFHVGSGATDPSSFKRAIKTAKLAFDTAESLGLPKLSLLDIGGGFSGGSESNGGVTMEIVSESINSALEENFPESEGVRVIAEPGRYFAEASATLCTSVFGRRIRSKDKVGPGCDTHAYWISDGLYGSFNCLLYDHATISVRTLNTFEDETNFNKSTVFGPTCDGLDTVLRSVSLPELSVGEWLVFDNMGAYTKAAGSSFNGFSVSDIKIHYGYST
mmetsp:Transcript_26050/g.35972  ORF Transcript_26050/g.35972 Transcript_26050/m.35972 type:complete len:806 (-) Transcript_26050:96-2513(-)|eukprot:CAMPEP_0196579310 /NCGR_PEP_ID=MMETSP1081-20130531/19921_1 /TAXON_ID=36882 /ORGANISM="Pyramimonas amylifera, Strain CCMP720" /LENGTH=805 /DNA_ID=CAMNT_0041898845 /DNA_START=482 /DNA_END=2899 /DNA_ORIENTATION=+